ncbi:MAG: hypothetical protein HGB23_01355 [Chlorobiaceae bacterium]|nr:hypothetical protein [Chlorobiaceae bacterium]
MIAVVSHDAGGAEILSSYVRAQDLDVLYVLDGPARTIFERKLGKIEIIALDEAIRKSTSIICSTSWASDIEFNAIKLARTANKRSIAFLDHWVNYRDRFVRSAETVLPDEIWVGDVFAKNIAQEVFPDIAVTLVDNPYFKDVRKELLSNQSCRPSSQDAISILYVCEPISRHALLRHGDARFWGYVEEDALRYFLSNTSVLGKPIERILIRAHPSENADKYSWVQNEFNLPIEFGAIRTLSEEIAGCDVIVGCESMALVVGLLAGKKVISCIPPHGRACVLPHTEIIKIKDIMENKQLIYQSNE